MADWNAFDRYVQDAIRYEFAREGDRLERLAVKAPGMVWEAVRRPTA